MSSRYPDLHFSSFPDAIDARNLKADASSSTHADIITYFGYVDNGNYAAANALLENSQALRSVINTAEDYNVLDDAVIALERIFTNDVENYIAHVIKNKGAWSNATQYKKYDVVSYSINNVQQMYCAIPTDDTIIDVPVGTLPTNTDYWIVITLKGEQGESGTGLSIRGDWNNSTSYSVDDCVKYNGSLWYATSSSVGEIPQLGSSYWGLLGTIGRSTMAENFTLHTGTSNWISNTDVSDSSFYHYKYVLSKIGITVSDKCDAFFDLSSMETVENAIIANYVETTSDSIVFKSVNRPTSAITGTMYITNQA